MGVGAKFINYSLLDFLKTLFVKRGVPRGREGWQFYFFFDYNLHT